MILVTEPTRIQLVGYDHRIDELKQALTFTDQTAVYALARFKKNRWIRQKIGEEAFIEQINEMKSKQKICLLTEDDGKYFTYSGFINLIKNRFNDHNVQYAFTRPERKPLPWYNQPEYQLRYYQIKAADKLLEVGHGAVSMCTGSGKSATIREICKRLGLKTVIMAPLVAIAEQLYDDLLHHFGPSKVGFFGDGKKKTDKLITVGTAQSFTKVKEDSKEWDELSQAQAFIADESHMTAADSLEKVCMKLCASASYRFFFSATQTRNDGSELLLDGIIGPIVYTYDTVQGITEEFLAKPTFIIKESRSNSNYYNADTMRMLKEHLYKNSEIHEQAAKLANLFATQRKEQTLILIDHADQFKYLVHHLIRPIEFAHGPLSQANKDGIPKEFHKSDPKKQVKAFNNGEFSIMVGTSCIATGVDFRTVKNIINLQGGSSEIKVKQAIGRGTRIVPGKKNSFNWIDFDIQNIPLLHGHTAKRIEIYKDVYNNLKFI